MFILGPKHNFSQINQCAPQYEKIPQYQSFNFNLYVYNHKVESSPILSTWSLNLNGGMSLVKESAITLICSMIIFLSFTLSLMAKYLMSMCLLWLSLLLFLAIKTTAEILQKILKGLEIVSTIFSLEMKLLSHTPCDVV